MSTIKQIVVGPCDTHCSVAIGIKCWPPSVRPSDTATQWRADHKYIPPLSLSSLFCYSGWSQIVQVASWPCIFFYRAILTTNCIEASLFLETSRWVVSDSWASLYRTAIDRVLISRRSCSVCHDYASCKTDLIVSSLGRIARRDSLISYEMNCNKQSSSLKCHVISPVNADLLCGRISWVLVASRCKMNVMVNVAITFIFTARSCAVAMCPPVMFQYCIKTAKRIVEILSSSV